MLREMRLETLFRLSMRNADGTWVRPFGGAEAAGFGSGEGTVTGDVVRGRVRWANYPRRREHGVWTPDLRGVIETEDGAKLLVSEQGQSVEERTILGSRRAILTRIELLTEDNRYRWLNTSFLVGEGEIDEETEEWTIETYVCVNDVAGDPPAIGQPPPERFRRR